MANAKSSTPKKRGKGRPRLEYGPDVINLLKTSDDLGPATVSDINRVLNISNATFYSWLKEHSDFSETVMQLRASADDKVVNSLYDRAVGFDYTETSTKTEEGAVKEGDIGGTKVTETIHNKVVIPDVGAAMNWLKNRRPEEWRDKQEVEVTGSFGDLVDQYVAKKEAARAAAEGDNE